MESPVPPYLERREFLKLLLFTMGLGLAASPLLPGEEYIKKPIPPNPLPPNLPDKINAGLPDRFQDPRSQYQKDHLLSVAERRRKLQSETAQLFSQVSTIEAESTEPHIRKLSVTQTQTLLRSINPELDTSFESSKFYLEMSEDDEIQLFKDLSPNRPQGYSVAEIKQLAQQQADFTSFIDEVLSTFKNGSQEIRDQIGRDLGTITRKIWSPEERIVVEVDGIGLMMYLRGKPTEKRLADFRTWKALKNWLEMAVASIPPGTESFPLKEWNAHIGEKDSRFKFFYWDPQQVEIQTADQGIELSVWHQPPTLRLGNEEEFKLYDPTAFQTTNIPFVNNGIWWLPYSSNEIKGRQSTVLVDMPVGSVLSQDNNSVGAVGFVRKSSGCVMNVTYPNYGDMDTNGIMGEDLRNPRIFSLSKETCC